MERLKNAHIICVRFQKLCLYIAILKVLPNRVVCKAGMFYSTCAVYQFIYAIQIAYIYFFFGVLAVEQK